jgi:hypothetical protein
VAEVDVADDPRVRDEAWIPLPREVLDSPEWRTRIEQARRRIDDGDVTPGKDAEQVSRFAEERRASVDP